MMERLGDFTFDADGDEQRYCLADDCAFSRSATSASSPGISGKKTMNAIICGRLPD